MRRGTRCKSNQHFAEQFPRTIARNGDKALTGMVIRKAREPDCFIIQWDQLITPWKLHRSFLTVSTSSDGERQPEGGAE